MEIKHFFELKKVLHEILNTNSKELYEKVYGKNPWFTKSNIELAIKNILFWFEDKDTFENWFNKNKLNNSPKNVGIIVPGNIPLVGLHDIISVLASQNSAIIKISHQDAVLTNYCIDKWVSCVPEIKPYIVISSKLKKINALIATGSNNSARYFEFHFKNIPRLIRKNKTSVAIVDSTWTKNMYNLLAKDILNYFGRGCRNVSKVFLENDSQKNDLINSLTKFDDLKHHNKYWNNFRYQKSILKIQKIQHHDTGFFILQKSNKLHSPLAVLYYDYYNKLENTFLNIEKNENSIQCVVTSKQYQNSCPFHTILPGLTQKPNINDFTDTIETSFFLNTL